MSVPIVFLLDVLPADTVIDDADLTATITPAGDGSGVLSVFDLGPARGTGSSRRSVSSAGTRSRSRRTSID
ncbi:hypothetical protein [Plantibacter sp. M259]|uniref:hypothetical protein n=1 Tax=Plantibacter sp. M259 TaxID=2583822 RepID=UPI001F0DBE73|nr:hypothetical protein [Plantibacter sp. M259]